MGRVAVHVVIDLGLCNTDQGKQMPSLWQGHTIARSHLEGMVMDKYLLFPYNSTNIVSHSRLIPKTLW